MKQHLKNKIEKGMETVKMKSTYSSGTIFQSSCEKEAFIKTVKFSETNFRLVNTLINYTL